LVKFRFLFLFAFIFFLGTVPHASAQADSVIGQISNSAAETFVTGISGNGRFVVMESTGNIATENPRNSDNNREIFLFDYAQRRIFQITDTKSLLNDRTKAPTFDNIKVEMVNQRPVISNDGRWIAFNSNATCAYPGNLTATPPLAAIVSNTNPGNFDANSTAASFNCNRTPGDPATSNLVNDGNTEIWLYQIPDVAPVDLSLGDEVPFVDLSAGTFTRVTNTLPSRLPVAGTASTLPIIADDNRDPSIDDTGSAIAFISNRDLEPCPTGQTPSATCGNQFPDFDNPEVYSFVRAAPTIKQVTATPRGTILAPIYNLNPNISNLAGGGFRVAFLSNGNNPVKGMTGGNNADRTDEIFYADLDANGSPTGTKRQVTQTAAATAGTIVNIFSYGRRMSRDGRYIAFESIADLTNENGGNNYSTTAVFVFDANAGTNQFRRVTPRGDADSGAPQGDVLRFPTFTDYDANAAPATLVFTTRLNITPTGTIPSNAADGLNNVSSRPPQVYTLPLAGTTYTRVSKFPTSSVVANTQAYASNSRQRMAFSLAQVELGTGNFDFLTETYYLLTPEVQNTAVTQVRYSTGASAIPVSASPVPTPTATATPTPSPSPSASPTPQTPPAVQGVSPGMLVILNFDTGFIQPIPTRTAVGSIRRSFQLPLELSGVTMTINGVGVGLKTVTSRQITFVVPLGLSAGSSGATVYPVVINNNGTVSRAEITIVPARPDIFTNLPIPGPGGRARAQNVTNRVPTTEPFTVTTVKIKGGRRAPTVLRVYATGVFNPTLPAGNYSIRIGSTTIVAASPPVQREPGVYTIDFILPADLNTAGDQPVVLLVTVGGTVYSSRLDDTAPRIRIL
jgi:uncharacterized protein (TIGR03437 family)